MHMKPGVLNSGTQETMQKISATLSDSMRPGKCSERHLGRCLLPE